MTLDERKSIPTGEWISRSAEQTFQLGSRVGEQLAGGEILLLDGTFGAGKTVFTKGLATALGINDGEVTSPSFTLVNLYHGRLTLYHLDLYRLPSGFSAAGAVDLDELLTDEEAVIVIEWAERMRGYPLPPLAVWHVQIEEDDNDSRRISITRPPLLQAA